jgi:hypothetical protein
MKKQISIIMLFAIPFLEAKTQHYTHKKNKEDIYRSYVVENENMKKTDEWQKKEERVSKKRIHLVTARKVASEENICIDSCPEAYNDDCCYCKPRDYSYPPSRYARHYNPGFYFGLSHGGGGFGW